MNLHSRSTGTTLKVLFLFSLTGDLAPGCKLLYHHAGCQLGWDMSHNLLNNNRGKTPLADFIEQDYLTMPR